MRKLTYTIIILTLVVLGVVIRAEGSDPLGNRSRQIIINGSNKYKVFLLDEAIYKHAKRNLSDLRIVNSKGIHVPYYIDRGSNSNAVLHNTKPAVFTVINKEKQTDIKIENEDHLRIKAFILEVPEIFKRRYKVTGTDEEGQSVVLTSGEIYNLDFKETSAKRRTIYFNDYALYQTFNISIYNEDDQPLDIQEIKTNYWTDQVVFAVESQEIYTLWYDNKEALKPSYDIEEYRTYVKKELKDVCTLAEPIIQEVTVPPIQPPVEKPINMQIVFNVLIVITAGVLIVIVLKKLKTS